LTFLLSATAVLSTQTDAGWEMLVTSAGPGTPRTCFTAPKVPSYASGSFFIAGPAKFEIGKYHFGGIFDGFGKLNRFELSEGKICYTSSWMNTGYKSEMEKLGEPRCVLFEDTVPPRAACPMEHPLCNMGAVPADNNWVSMITVGGEAEYLSDTPTFKRMDMRTLNVTGTKVWKDDSAPSLGTVSPTWVHAGHIGATGSAHPLMRPGTNNYIDVVVEQPMVPMMESAYLSVYSFSSLEAGPQNRELITSIKMPKSQYFHSYGITENYNIFIYDLYVDMIDLFNPLLLGKFHNKWSKIHVFDTKGNPVQVFDAEPFVHVHIINSYENATGIVMDLPTQDANPFQKSAALDVELFKNKTARNSAKANANGVRRYHLHLSGPLKGQTTMEDLTPRNRIIDFPKINQARSGLEYCHYYAVEWFHNDQDYASMAVFKQTVCGGDRKVTYWSREDTYVGEPFFVGGGASGFEDDGLVVFVALDGRRKTSMFVVLDAKTMEEIEVIDLPQHIPFTAHGQFVPRGAAHPLHSPPPQAVVV